MRTSEDPAKELETLEKLLDSKFLEKADEKSKDSAIKRLEAIYEKRGSVPIGNFSSFTGRCSSLIKKIEGSKKKHLSLRLKKQPHQKKDPN